jgi:hypothetical protein
MMMCVKKKKFCPEKPREQATAYIEPRQAANLLLHCCFQFSFLIRPRRCSLVLIQLASPRSHVLTGPTAVDGSDDADDVGHSFCPGSGK